MGKRSKRRAKRVLLPRKNDMPRVRSLNPKIESVSATTIMSGIITQPGSIKKVAVAALFKLKTPAFDKEECKACLKSISDDLTEYTNWLKASMDQKLKDIEAYVMSQKKQKALDCINYRMRGDNTLAMIEVLTPMVEKVRKAYKTILKEDSVPSDVKVELSTIIYLVDLLNIGNWNKLKKQLELKYGSEWTEKIQEKKKNVEPKILEFVDYKPKEKIVRDKYKEFEDAWKLKLKKEEEDLDIEELSDDVETESDTHIHDDHNLDNLDDVTLSPKDKKKKKSLKKDSSSDSDSSSEEEKPKKSSKKGKKESSSSSDSDSDSDSSSEEEKPKKTSKKAAKESSSDSDSDSDSSSEEEKPKKVALSSSSSSDSEEEKPKKKASKKAKKESSSDSDSSSD